MEWIGYIAAICTTLSFLPQVIHLFKTQNTTGISLGMYVTFVFGVGMWLVYGFLLRDLPLILANTVTFLLSATILTMKVRDVLKK
jgi:MtN3 and saliva related transmembrane protein